MNKLLPGVVPGLKYMTPTANVTGVYRQLYDLKVKHLQSQLTNLEKALSKRNFHDCETMLEMAHPRSRQKVILIQTGMDVVAGGSVRNSILIYSNRPLFSQRQNTDGRSKRVALISKNIGMLVLLRASMRIC